MLKVLLLSGPVKKFRQCSKENNPNDRNFYAMQYLLKNSIIVDRIERETGISVNPFSALLLDLIESFAYCRNFNKYDVLFSYYELFAIFPEIARRILKQNKAAHITTSFMLTNLFIGSALTQKINRFLVGPLCRQILNRISLFIFYSTSQMKYFQNIVNVPPSKTQFVNLGIDTKYFSPQKGNDEYILSAGKNSGRDYDTLISAFANSKSKLQIVCTRDQKMRYKTRNISIKYDVNYATLRDLYKNAKFVVIPLKNSYTLAGQLVMLESFAMGKAVIATRCWGTEDYITEGKTGLFVSPGNILELKEKIEYLLDNPKVAERIGRNAREFVERNCSLENYAKNIYCLTRRTAEQS